MIKGISGGQAKRTNIGIALVTSPRVLFLGELLPLTEAFWARKGLVNAPGDGMTVGCRTQILAEQCSALLATSVYSVLLDILLP